MLVLNLVLVICLIICLVYIFKLRNDLEQSGFWQEYEHQEADENRRTYWLLENGTLKMYYRNTKGVER